MKEAPTIDRREFSVKAALAILSGALITISGCSDDGTPGEPSPLAEGDVAGVVSANHGHVAVITRAEIVSGNELALNIRGSADHTHTVTLTAAEIAQIGVGQPVMKQSSSEMDHEHTVTFN